MSYRTKCHPMRLFIPPDGSQNFKRKELYLIGIIQKSIGDFIDKTALTFDMRIMWMSLPYVVDSLIM